MKTQITKAMLGLALSLSVVSGVAHADAVVDGSGECKIVLTAPCVPSPATPINKSFSDVKGTLSNVDATRCLQRAKEYRDWCTNANDKKYDSFYVTSTFNVNGKSIITAVSYKGGGYIQSEGFVHAPVIGLTGQ